MNERDERARSPGPRLLVDESDTAGLQLAQRGAEVLDAQCHVVQSGSVAVQKPPNRRVRGCGLQQLQAGATGGNESRANALALHVFRCLDLETESVSKERQRLVDVLDGDA